MAAVVTPSEIQVILRITTDYSFISDMIPIVQDTIDRYFKTDFSGSYPIALKRPAAVLIRQTMENPGAVWMKKIGDDETEYKDSISLKNIFAGLEDLIVNDNHQGVQVLNVRIINDNLGI